MECFLYRIASRYVAEHGSDLKDLCFVFPNRRSSLFFRKYLGQNSKCPILCPDLTTVSDFFASLSSMSLGDRIELLYILYGHYSTLCPRYDIISETFDEFVGWGDMILSDFNDIDKYIVDADVLFENIEDLHRLDTDYSFLKPEQIEAIKHFWNSFQSQSWNNRNERIFRNTWMLLKELYSEYREDLLNRGIAYEGMIFREVAEKISNADEQVAEKLGRYEKIVFVGQNALCEAEKKLYDYVRDSFNGDFYWDFNGPMVTDPCNKASLFIKENVKRYPSRFHIDGSVDSQPFFEVVSVPSSVGQAKIAAEYLKLMDADSTAVVLPDENLLMPLLNSIPQSIENINVTMGYSLQNSAFSTFMDFLAKLQLNKSIRNGKELFYHKDVLSILNHMFIASRVGEEISMLKVDIVRRNMVMFGYEGDDGLLRRIFTPQHDCNVVCDWLMDIISDLAQTVSPIEREFAQCYYQAVTRLRDLNIPMEIRTYFKFLKQITSKMSVPFRGEPLQGLQIMGPLETRLLDFENVIVLSVNEDVFPSRSVGHSFIPYNLRLGYGLPTMEYLDAIAAYHFYRSVYRARRVVLIYDSRQNGLNRGEESRYIKQLKYHYGVPLKERTCAYVVAPARTCDDTIGKTQDVMERLQRKYVSEGRKFSASSLNDYLDCPAKFYYKHLMEIKKQDEVSDDVGADVFGSIFHKTMESLYGRFVGKMVYAADIDRIMADKSHIKKTVCRNLMEELNLDSSVLAGKLLIDVELVTRLVLQTLKNDTEIAPFTYLAGEALYAGNIKIREGLGCEQVGIKGYIDRLDIKDGKLRICDYKSGYIEGETAFNGKENRILEEMFETGNLGRPKYLFQTAVYAWLIRQSGDRYKKYEKSLVLYNLRSCFVENPSGETCRDDFLDLFEVNLRNLASEIFDPDIPFVYCPDTRGCEYCDAASVCRKKIAGND